MRVLLGAGADAEARSERAGKTPLIVAALEGHSEVIFILHSSGANLETQSNNGMTALQWAAMSLKGSICVGLLVRLGSNPNSRSARGASALHFAAVKGRVEVATLLLSAGSLVDAADNQGNTPLHWAARAGCAEAVRLFTGAGALLDATGEHGATAMHNAVDSGDSATEIIESLLEKGADPNLRDIRGFTPLMLAAIRGHGAAAEALMKDARADINLADGYGETALFWASWKGHTQVIEKILGCSQKTPVEALSHEAKVPLTLATRETSGDNEALFHLGPNSCSALHRAALGGHIDTIYFLTRRGADVNQADAVRGLYC